MKKNKKKNAGPPFNNSLDFVYHFFDFFEICLSVTSVDTVLLLANKTTIEELSIDICTKINKSLFLILYLHYEHWS